MRVLQTKILVDSLNKTNPAETLSVYGLPNVNPGLAVLIDDQGVSTTIKPLEVVVVNAQNGILFVAKDEDTLYRGFKALAASGKTKGKREFYMREEGGSGLAALGFVWDRGDLRHKNQAAAALSTVGHNVTQFLTRVSVGSLNTLFPSLKLNQKGVIDHYQSVSGNMERASRDGSLVSRGAGIYVCPAAKLPLQLKWGVPYRQIGDTLTLGMLATITKKILTA